MKMTTSKTMKKDDLRSGYVVAFRNGERRLVMRAGNFTKILIGTDGKWNYLNSNWGADLKATYNRYDHCSAQSPRYGSLSDWDIMEVYGLVSAPVHYHSALFPEAIENRKLLWERKKAVKMTVAEICEKLGYDVEIVADANSTTIDTAKNAQFSAEDMS